MKRNINNGVRRPQVSRPNLAALGKRPLVSLIGIAALAAIITFTLAGCGGKKDSGGGGGSASASSSKSSGGGKANPASDFQYDLTADGQGILIKGYTGGGGKVVVPEKIEDMPVVEIGASVFQGSNITGNMNGDVTGSKANAKAGITAITLPNTVKKIGAWAFQDTAITKFDMPDSVTEIDIHLFAGCKALTEVHLSDNIERFRGSIGTGALKKVNLPKNLKRIGYGAFSGFPELSELVIPDTLTSVEFVAYDVDDTWTEKANNGAFEGCGKLPIKVRQTIQGWGYAGKF